MFPGLRLPPRLLLPSLRPRAWGQQPTAAKSSRRTLAAPAAAPAAPAGAAPPRHGYQLHRQAGPGQHRRRICGQSPSRNSPGRSTGKARDPPGGREGRRQVRRKAGGQGGKAGGKNPGRTAAGGPDESLDPVPAKAFSGRLLALGVVMIAITILLAPTVKIFLDKRAEIAALQADIAAKQTKQEDLKRQVSRWQDPNYVKQQARDRINMVMPGETGYWVFGSDLPAAQSGGAAGAASAQDPADLPWVDSLWESIRRSATD